VRDIMSEGCWARLPDRGIVSVGGADAEPFLQNLLTCDLAKVDGDAAGFGALLSPQGKILFDFILYRASSGFLLDLPRPHVGELTHRLSLYRLRADVTIADRSGEDEVQVAWGADRPTGRFVLDPRVARLGYRQTAPAGSAPDNAGREEDAARYQMHRILLGVPEGGVDFTYGDTFPHDANMDGLAGIAFGKGCFVGQEVVSRMQHRGTARRRIVQVRGGGLSAGTEITDGAIPVGRIGSVSGANGLAMVRIDRVADAAASGRRLSAGGDPVELAVPDWARFDLPPAAA
jgi:tRNA-modifying protein YgfZ